MENIIVRFLIDMGDYVAGDEVEMAEDVAQKLVEAGVCEVVEEATEETLDKVAKALEEKIVAGIEKSISKINVKVPAVARNDEDKSFNDWLCAVGKTASQNYRAKEQAHNYLANKYGQKATTVITQGTSATPYGGYLVPPEYSTSLLYSEGFEPVWQRANVLPMNSNVIYVPVLDQTSTPSSGSSAFAGGCVVSVVGEGNTPTNSTQPAFKQVPLTCKKVLAFSEISNEMLDNSNPAVQPIVERNVRTAINSWADYEMFNGAGGSTHLTGLIDNDATKKVTRTSDLLADLANMWAGLLPESRKRAVWVMNPLVLGSLPTLGNSNHLVWLQQGAAAEVDLRLFGLPIVVSEALPVAGEPGDVMLVDFYHYLVGLNKDIVVDSSPHIKFTSDITTLRASVRIDAKPAFSSTFVLQDGSSTVAPYIQLDEASS